MGAITCIVEVGHGENTPARWRSEVNPTMTVCDRHRNQYNERLSDLGPFDWRPICGDSAHRHSGPCHLYRPPDSSGRAEADRGR